MEDWQVTRLADADLNELFDRLFPQGFAGADVMEELAPQGWEKSPLLACFHPSPEQVFKECLRMHGRLEESYASHRKREPDNPKFAPKPEPTLEEVKAIVDEAHRERVRSELHRFDRDRLRRRFSRCTIGRCRRFAAGEEQRQGSTAGDARASTIHRDQLLPANDDWIFLACSRCATKAGRTLTSSAFSSSFLALGISVLSIASSTCSW